MKKMILIALSLSLSFTNAEVLNNNDNNISLNRKVDLLTDAVSILIEKNRQLKNQIEALKQVTKINSQMIASNRHIIENLDKNGVNSLAIVTAYKLNVRAKPSSKSKVIRKLKKGDVVKVYDTIARNKEVWYKIVDGYISAYYTNLVVRRKKW